MASVAVLASVDVVDRAMQLVLNGRSRERHAGYVQLLGLLGQSEGVDYDEIFERVFVKLGNKGMRIALQDFGSIDRGLRITSGKVVVACLLLQRDCRVDLLRVLLPRRLPSLHGLDLGRCACHLA